MCIKGSGKDGCCRGINFSKQLAGRTSRRGRGRRSARTAAIRHHRFVAALGSRSKKPKSPKRTSRRKFQRRARDAAGDDDGGEPPQARFVAPASLKLHTVAGIIPEMSSLEWGHFVEEVKKNGITDPLKVVGNRVVDGRHRLRAARQLGLKKIPVVDVRLASASAVQEFLLLTATARRHLTDDQRALLAAKYALLNRRKPGRPRRSP